jgi:hypothetical protein
VPIGPGDKTPLVIGVDAATTGDCFAIVAVSRHPDPARHDQIAVRAVKVWNPRETGGVVDYAEPEAFLRLICRGGCAGDGHGNHHPKTLPSETCSACIAGDWSLLAHNVVQVAFDPYQLESTAQRLTKDRIAWCEPFNQAGDRLRADRALYDAILGRRLAHDGNALLKQHILNAGAKVQKSEDSTLRLVKVNPNRKIDAAVALSMASAKCLYLTL